MASRKKMSKDGVDAIYESIKQEFPASHADFTCGKCGAAIYRDDFGVLSKSTQEMYFDIDRLRKAEGAADWLPLCDNCFNGVSSSNAGNLIRCPDCGKDVSYRATSCPHCGCPVNLGQKVIQSTKHILPTFLFFFFLGVIGLHRFYVGKPASGLLMPILFFMGFITSGVSWIVLGVWGLVDFIMIVSGSFTDGQGLQIKKWT